LHTDAVRVRTAIGVAIGVVATKAALVWVALLAWESLPERPGFVGHWQIQLGPLSEWVGALFTAGAVAVALWIAGHESRSRRRERDEADHAQARLVQLEVKQVRELPDFDVEIHNYGDRAIIGAAVTTAWYWGHPDYTWRHSDINHDREKVVRPERESPGGSVRIQFLDAAGNFVPKLIERTRLNEMIYEKVEPPEAVIAFMDANGTLWQTGTAMPPQRIDSPPTSLDPGGPTTK
jgi:hypothetical protein